MIQLGVSRSGKKKVAMSGSKDDHPRSANKMYRSTCQAVQMRNLIQNNKNSKKGMIHSVIKSGRHLIIKINLINHNRKDQPTRSRNSKSCFHKKTNTKIPWNKPSIMIRFYKKGCSQIWTISQSFSTQGTRFQKTSLCLRWSPCSWQEKIKNSKAISKSLKMVK
jgi:hypothetical protein